MFGSNSHVCGHQENLPAEIVRLNKMKINKCYLGIKYLSQSLFGISSRFIYVITGFENI